MVGVEVKRSGRHVVGQHGHYRRLCQALWMVELLEEVGVGGSASRRKDVKQSGTRGGLAGTPVTVGLVYPSRPADEPSRACRAAQGWGKKDGRERRRVRIS